MSRPPSDLPERLLTADATDFERRVIEAALSGSRRAAASARMARALGVAVTGVATSSPRRRWAPRAASKATAVAGSVHGLALAFGRSARRGRIGGAVVGARAWRASRPSQLLLP